MHTPKAEKNHLSFQCYASPESLSSLASQIEERRVVLQRCKRKRQIRLCRIGVLQGVPENVAGAKKRASNLVVVTLGVLERCDSRAGDGANARPASLSDPDGLASRNALSLSEAGVEVFAGLLNGVGARGLEVGEGVVTEPTWRVSRCLTTIVRVVSLTS